jgi:predicted PolB exonuclease-like 3'-5' exonuclease
VIITLDIETIPNPAAIAMMPEPEVKTGNIKNPALIAEKVAEAKRDQIEKAALNPLTARVACCAYFTGENDHVDMIGAVDDSGEAELIQSIMRVLGNDGVRLVTFNGMGFDLPMIYKRALVLGVNPGHFGAPPLTAWTKRYNTDRHFDLMQIWCGWNGFAKLDVIAGMVLGERKAEFDVTTIAALLETEEGRKRVTDYCLQDTCLTWRLWERFNGTLFVG